MKNKESDTLVIFDEIQEMPEILWNVRYFYEEDSEYHIICASSQMNITSCAEFPFPMEKAEFLKLYPMSFQEFFWATKQEESYKKFFDTNNFNMMNIFGENYIEFLKQYYFVGGMPEAVLCFVETGDLNKVCDIQQKFMYGFMQEGGRAKFYEEAITWLDKYGFVYRVNRITQPMFPLKTCENTKAYKLFVVDIGLLGCMFDLSQDVFLSDDELFDKFGGALTEQYDYSR